MSGVRKSRASRPTPPRRQARVVRVLPGSPAR